MVTVINEDKRTLNTKINCSTSMQDIRQGSPVILLLQIGPHYLVDSTRYYPCHSYTGTKEVELQISYCSNSDTNGNYSKRKHLKIENKKIRN